MSYIADFHIHSHDEHATSKDIKVVGMGDFA